MTYFLSPYPRSGAGGATLLIISIEINGVLCEFVLMDGFAFQILMT